MMRHGDDDGECDDDKKKIILWTTASKNHDVIENDEADDENVSTLRSKRRKGVYAVEAELYKSPQSANQ